MATKTTMVRCIDCKNGEFMQWFQNPIICQCNILDERMVAEAQRLCGFFTQSNKAPEVKHYDKYDD